MSTGSLLSKLKTSWTKFSIVQVIEIIENNEVEDYLSKKKLIDEPILKSVLGIKNFTEQLPFYWREIQKYPEEKKMFTLLAVIFTHHSVISEFAQSSNDKMGGLLKVQEGVKQYTNLRRALIEANAAEPKYEKRKTVPYSFKIIYSLGSIGKLFKEVLKERLRRVGYENIENNTQFYAVCYDNLFHKVLGLSKIQFRGWLEGEDIITEQPETKIELTEFKTLKSTKALIVKQWMQEWDKVSFDGERKRTKPPQNFLIFSLPAKVLKRLSDVNRREVSQDRKHDKGIQRQLIPERSHEIARYIEGGYPWSELSNAKRDSGQFEDTRMPGWLPTAIVANIIKPGTLTKRGTMNLDDAITISEGNNEYVELKLPGNYTSASWNPQSLPIEIIDGQHRLLAFENANMSGDFELPIVAFYGLDVTWQAYLFYTINIKPKRINKSLAYDLYPLLRIQDWLEKAGDNTAVYKETRAQELTEILWMHPYSPWYNRINMLGDPKEGSITQAAFLRTLINSYLKKWEPNTNKIGGLFGAQIKADVEEVLEWSRTQQAAFLLLVWKNLEGTVSNCQKKWAKSLRTVFKERFNLFDEETDLDPAFISNTSLLATDQGVRGIMQVTNDLCYVGILELGLIDLQWENVSFKDEEEIKLDNVTKAFEVIKGHSISNFLVDVFKELMNFDWRTSSQEDLSEEEKRNQMIFRGSGGYKELRRQLLIILKKSSNKRIQELSTKVLDFLHF
jgi:DGQHR domain-containing protein